jgi:hypothetical protein
MRLQENLNQRMIQFLEMPNWRKMIYIKSLVQNCDGLTSKQLERCLRNITTHFELSLSRSLKKLPSEIYQTLADKRNLNRKNLVYRNNPKICR